MEQWSRAFYYPEKYFKVKSNCPQMPKCKRTVYKMVLFPDESLPHATQESVLIIQLESPNVQTIVDSEAYDLQSLIGEVGGTLGLFLGLSMFSFIDFFVYILRKMSTRKLFLN